MYLAVANKEGLGSLLSVPMMVWDKALGVINSYTSVPHVFYSPAKRSRCSRPSTIKPPSPSSIRP